jgi:hypothetical protein
MADESNGIYFTRPAAERIANAVRIVERSTQGGDGRGKRRIPVYTGGGTQWTFAVSPAGGIPARTGTPPDTLIPGAGQCRQYIYTSALVYQSASTVNVLNPWGGSVGGGRLIRAEFNEGQWWIVNEDCVATAGGGPVQQSISGFKPTAFSNGFASTLGTQTGAISTGAFSGGFGLTSFGGSGLVPSSPVLP